MSTTKKSVLNIAVSRNGKERTMVKVAEQATVSAHEVDTAEGMKQQFVYNVLAGMVDKVITVAHKYDGKDSKCKLPAILPHYGKDQLDALRKCLDATPAALRKAWAKKIRDSERVRLVSLTGLRAALKAGGSREPSTFTKKRFLECADKVDKTTWDLPDMMELQSFYVDASPAEK